MGIPNSYHWLFAALSWILASAAGLLLLGAMMWDRARGRQRCPNCWYALEGVAGFTCPECGRTASGERALFRTRRHWKLAALSATLLVAAHFVARAPGMQASGWVGALPTPALIWWVGRYEPPEHYDATKGYAPPSRYAAELARRAGAEGLWGWEWRWTLRAVGAVWARERWPVGTPYMVSTGLPWWLQSKVGWLSAESPFPDQDPLSGGLHPFAWSAGTLPEDATSLTLRMHIGNWAGSWRLPLRQVATIADAMRRHSDAELDNAVSRARRVGIYLADNPASGHDGLVFARLLRERGPLSADVAVCVRVELLRDDQTVHSWLLPMLDSTPGPPGDWIRFHTADLGWDPDGPQEISRWTVRVRGDAQGALADMFREDCWDGEFTLPLSQVLSGGR